MFWRIVMLSNVMRGVSDTYAIVGSDGWLFVAEPLDATTWTQHRHAMEAMERCPMKGRYSLRVEPAFR